VKCLSTRRNFLRGVGLGATAVAGISPLPYSWKSAWAAETVRAITWGGNYGDVLKQITDRYKDVEVDWSLYQSAALEILAKIRSSWPNPPVDMCETWDPIFLQLQGEGWLESVADSEMPNLADVPKNVLRYRDSNGRLFAIPLSVGASYWGYRKDLVNKPIRELSDLLDPSLKGKICLSNAVKGGAITVVVLAIGNGGSETNMEPGWEFMKKLAMSGNIGRIATTEVDFANSINSGETAVTFWNTATWNEIKKNWPCQILTKVESKSLKTFVYQEGFAILKSPRSSLAKQVLNFMLSPENNELYNNALGQAPVNRKSKVSAAAADFAMTEEEYKKYAYFLDYETMNRQRDGWIRRWEQEIQPLLRA
jgi:putative spermidine/putrescine transport system substrate-binding protein